MELWRCSNGSAHTTMELWRRYSCHDAEEEKNGAVAAVTRTEWWSNDGAQMKEEEKNEGQSRLG